MTDAEIKGKKFLDYVANNMKRLRRNLMKNITYDEELFDDVFQESIIKVYNSIVKNNKDIDDYEQYFFTSSKFNYILKQNSERQRTKKKVNIDDFIQNNDIEVDEVLEYDTQRIIDDLRSIIEERFGVEYSDLYFDYMSMKVYGGMSYSKYAQMKNIPVSRVSDIVCRVKNYIKNNERIKKFNYALDI